MGEKKIIEALISGGQATAGPPLGPALGPLGVNTLQVVNKINELTNAYSGMKVPIKITVDAETKEFEVDIGTTTVSALLVKELNIEKGSGNPKEEKVGDISLEIIKKLAEMKMTDSYARDQRGAMKEILGTCLSMGVTVDGKDPREIQRELEK